MVQRLRFGDSNPNVRSNSARDRVQARPLAFRTNLAIALLPFEPRFLDRIRARAAIHLRQIEQFAETRGIPGTTLATNCS